MQNRILYYTTHKTSFKEYLQINQNMHIIIKTTAPTLTVTGRKDRVSGAMVIITPVDVMRREETLRVWHRNLHHLTARHQKDLGHIQ